MAESPSELQIEVDKLERKHAENPEGRYFVPLANAYRKLGDLARAEALLREGLRRHPDYLSAHIVLGRCLADRQATPEAVEEFRYVLSLDPQNLIALRTLGELALAQGRQEEAQRWYQELLSVDPMNEDARRALESLSAGAAAPPEEFRAEATWWERPAEEEPHPAAPAEAAPEPASELGYIGSTWIELEPQAEEEEESRAPAPRESAGERDDISSAFGSFLELEPTSPVLPEPELREGDETEEPTPEEPEEGGAVEVVTETIAELYARQGLYERSAEVYRELIRRRGGDPALERRLAEVEERMGTQGAAPEPAAPAPAEESSPEPETAIALESFPAAFDTTDEPVEIAPEPADPFAASFADGFSELEVSRPEPDTSTPAPREPAAASASVPGPTIAGFLSQLAGWRPAARPAERPAPAPEAPAPAAEPLPAERPEVAPIPEWEFELPAAAEPTGGTASGTVPAEEEPFPWELPPPPGDEAPTAPPPAAAEREPSFDELFPEGGAGGDARPAPQEGPAPSAAEPVRTPGVPAPAEEEEEDLESFQAWLRSLKR